MTGGPRILRRDQVGRLRQTDAILRDAEQHSQASRAQAEQHQRDLMAEARGKALRESARTAARVLAEAEAAAQRRLTALEPELARLVAMTVRRIIGDFAPHDAAHRAALTALRQMRDHRRGRIFAAPDTLEPVERAVADLGPDGGPQILGIHPDPALDAGRAVLTSDHGSVEIGLAALTDRALQAWEPDGAPDPRPAPGDPAAKQPPVPSMAPSMARPGTAPATQPHTRRPDTTPPATTPPGATLAGPDRQDQP